jgi:hypothetical protein
MIYGSGRLITDPEEKTDALFRFSEKLLPGRWNDTRPMTEQELKATAAVAVPIESASAKVRSGMPADEPEDVDLPYWGGIIPVRQVFDDPIPDSYVTEATPAPGYLLEHVARNRE